MELAEFIGSVAEPDPVTGCRNWMKGGTKAGYGLAQYGGKVQYTHRLSYGLMKGPIPPGLCVCHKCDNPRCVEPEHLFLGTQGDNNRDRTAKGRTTRGVDHYRAKLTPKQVVEIRSRHVPYSRGPNGQRGLAREFGVSQQTVSELLRREIWAHVAQGD